MRQRGHVLLLMMIVLAAMLAAGVVFTSRLSVRVEDRDAADVRVQALWLARTALETGVGGARQVQTASGPAEVRVEGSGARAYAEVDLQGAHAVVGGVPRTERFTPAGGP